MFSDQFRRGETDKSKLTGITGSKVVSALSDVAWKAFQSVNQRLPEGEAIRPNWAPGPLLKSYERSAPPLGFPRETDSLCPRCVKEVRDAVISGETTLETLMHQHPGEIKAQILEEDGRVIMRKTCPKHGEFKDVMATDPAFLERIESLFFGRDFRAAEDANVHKHGTSNIKFGRGAVLTVDLTNRCNMMCNPCFMDANQVGYVHEPTFEDTKAILDRAVSFKPRRQVIILFSGGEPTLSPYYLEAVAYARKIGFYRILAATNINIPEALANKRLREDLYYRLNAFTLQIPPLRERREEIPILLKHFMTQLSEEYARPPLPFSPELLQACAIYPWPGNLRELGNFIKRYLVLGDEKLAINELQPRSDGSGAQFDAAPPRSSTEAAGTANGGGGLKSLARSAKDEAEAEAIAKALDETNWNRKQAAALLQISYKALLYKIRQYGIAQQHKSAHRLSAGAS